MPSDFILTSEQSAKLADIIGQSVIGITTYVDSLNAQIAKGALTSSEANLAAAKALDNLATDYAKGIMALENYLQKKNINNVFLYHIWF